MRVRTFRVLAVLALTLGTLALAGCMKARCNDPWGCYEPCDLLGGPCQ
ncbi:MAG: hypothetical protein R3F05_12175 [Planctomycetota bacterium]|nr:hypothetical protein [Planctomycetota bacterium]MCB9825538.1 hypothetical protein [Planctomycetota bacterium]MCB9900632.1 hypothetical protein [Planctomycetota bacterium]